MDRSEFIETIISGAENVFSGSDKKDEEQAQELKFMKALAAGETESIFQERVSVAQRTCNPYLRAGEIREIADQMLLFGMVEQAAKLVESIEDPYQRDWVNISIAGALASAGKVEEALSLINGIKDGDCRTRALSATGRALAEASSGLAGDILKKAMDGTENMKDPYDSMWVMCDIGKAVGAAGDEIRRKLFDMAIDKIHYICHTVKRASSFRAIAESMHEAGEGRAEQMAGMALESAEAIEENEGKANALAWVAATMTKIGDPRAEETLGKAVEAAKRVKDPENMSRAFRWIAGALAESGDHENALALARGIRHSFFRYEALRDVSTTFVKSGNYKYAAGAVDGITEPGPRIEVAKELVVVCVADSLQKKNDGSNL